MSRLYATHRLAAGLTAGILLSGKTDAWAVTMQNVTTNTVTSVKTMPQVASAALYIIGLVLGAQGILKVKQSVENSNQHPTKDGIARILASGACFAAPYTYNAAKTTIDGGSTITSPGTPTFCDVGSTSC